MSRLIVKLLAASVGFLPLLAVILIRNGTLPDSRISHLACVPTLPGFLPAAALQFFHVGKGTVAVGLLAGVLAWSLLLAYMLWRYAAMLLGEDEPGARKFDWAGWRVRFFCGALIGFLSGWRFAAQSDGKTILAYMCATAVFGGLALGAWREEFWKRPL